LWLRALASAFSAVLLVVPTAARADLLTYNLDNVTATFVTAAFPDGATDTISGQFTVDTSKGFAQAVVGNITVSGQILPFFFSTININNSGDTLIGLHVGHSDHNSVEIHFSPAMTAGFPATFTVDTIELMHSTDGGTNDTFFTRSVTGTLDLVPV